MHLQEKVISADIGGSHISVAAVNLKERRILPSTTIRRSLNAKASADEILNSWCTAFKLSSELAAQENFRLSLAMPGPFDYEQGVSYIKENDKYEALYGLNVKLAISTLLGISPLNIKMKNDAECFLAGEVLGGAARVYGSAIGITLGTGLGSAIYKNGKTVDAERWSIKFKDGIAEGYFSSRWFQQQYELNFRASATGVREMIENHQGDQRLTAIFKEFSFNLSSFLIDFMTDHPVEVVIIGGNISRASSLFLSDLQTNVKNVLPHVPVKIAELGESAAILGAAGDWLN